MTQQESLLEFLEAKLGKYKTTVEEDRQKLAQGGLSPNMENIIKLELQEQQHSVKPDIVEEIKGTANTALDEHGHWIGKVPANRPPEAHQPPHVLHHKEAPVIKDEAIHQERLKEKELWERGSQEHCNIWSGKLPANRPPEAK
jgi:hypothetical protein